MAFSTVIAILAIGIALVALWLVSDILKKVEGQNEKFLRAHIAALREEIRDTDRSIAKVAKGVAALHEGHTAFDKRFNEHTADIEAVRGQIAKVAENLDFLDRSIPQRFRVRVVPPAEADGKTAAKAKPTVQ